MRKSLPALVLGTCILFFMQTPANAQDREEIDVASLGPQVGELSLIHI